MRWDADAGDRCLAPALWVDSLLRSHDMPSLLLKMPLTRADDLPDSFGVMKALLYSIAALVVLPIHQVDAQQKLGGSMRFLALRSNTPIKSAKVGQTFRIQLVGQNLNLIGNRQTTGTYTLSVLPAGSQTPVTISGKLSGLMMLPKSQGGARKTAQELASLRGTTRETLFVTVPDFMPAGRATLTLSLSARNAGAVTLRQGINIRL